MSAVIAWMAAEGEGNQGSGARGQGLGISVQGAVDESQREVCEEELALWEAAEAARERWAYRRKTVEMLRRYMRYAIETGRLPSLLGREFFRAKVTSYTVVTFERNDVRRTVIERLVNAMIAVAISVAIAHGHWWR